MSQAASDRVRRHAAVLYADITGSTVIANQLDPEEAHALIAGAVARLERIARAHGASLVNYRGDGILALFGIPMALEGAARAALNAAIEMVAPVPSEPGLPDAPTVHVGVSAGLLVAGDVSGSDQPEIDVMGGAVPLAARLSDLAPPGGVYVDPECRSNAPAAFEFRPLGPLQIKGLDRPVESYELLSRTPQRHHARPQAPHAPELVGRDEMIGRLERAIEALGTGPGQVQPLVGDAGIGKTRLVSELRQRAKALRCTWLEGRCVPSGARLSFHPFGDLLRNWVGLPDPTAPGALEALGQKTQAVLGVEADDALPYLARLAGIPVEGSLSDRFEGPEGDSTLRLITLSLKRLVAGLAKRDPVVLVLEDLHWADASSLDLLAPLAELARASPVLLIPTLRPEWLREAPELDPELRSVLSGKNRIELTPLDTEESLALARTLLEDARPTLLEQVARQSAGNPFFLEELARAIVEHPASESGAPADALPEASTSMREVVLARVDRLPSGASKLLELASVLGTSFERSLLGRLGAGDQDVDEHLPVLLEAQILEEADAATGALDFRHPVIREIVYDSVLVTGRRSLHLRAAQALEEELAADFPGRSAMLALHYTRGGDAERAEQHLLQAGADAARGASRESLYFFREAARLFEERQGETSDPETLRTVNQGIANALFNLGEVGQAIPYLEAVLESLGARVPRSPTRLRARLAWLVARLWLESTLGWEPRRPPATEHDLEIIDTAFRRALGHVTTDPSAYALLGMDTLRIIRSFDPRTIPGSAGIYSASMVMFSLAGISFRIAENLRRKAEALVDAEDWNELLWFEAMQFIHCMLVGDWRQELEIPPEKLDRAVARGELWVPISYLGLEVRKKANQGRFAEAEAALGRITQIEQRYEYELARSNRESTTAFLHLERRELDAAEAIADTYHRTHDEEPFQIMGAGLKAKAQILKGDLEGAAVTLARGEEIAARTAFLTPYHQTPLRVARLRLDLAELESARAQGRPPRALVRRARRDARRAVRLARWHAAERTETYRLAGRLAWLRGREPEAWRWWQRSLEEAERLGARPGAARTMLEIAEAFAGDGEARGHALTGRPSDEWRERGTKLLEEIGLGLEAGVRLPAR